VDPGTAANTLKGIIVTALTDDSGLFMPLLALRWYWAWFC
jgi:hypothetical protein